MLSELENQNDQHLEGISAKVKMLKDVRFPFALLSSARPLVLSSHSPLLPSLPPHTDLPKTDHSFHRRRNPLLVLPRRIHERLLRQHARAVAGDDEPHVADGGEDGSRVEGLGGVYSGGLVAFCLCLAILT